MSGRAEMVVKINRALGALGLPDWDEVQGAKFMFYDSDHAVIGQVTSIGFSPDEGIRLYVSVRRFCGINVRRLELQGGTWLAMSEDSKEVRHGVLELL